MFLNLPFQDPERVRQMREQRARNVMSRAVPWPEARKPKGRHDIGIIAETYVVENPMDFVFPDAPVVAAESDECLYSGNRTLRYAKKVFPKLHGLPVTDAPDLWYDHGRAFFTDDVVFPVLEHKVTEYRKEKWRPWMSLTPHEIWSQRSGVRAATKDVVLGGLGMGWLLQEVAKKKTVKSITVVEIDGELIEWFGHSLVAAVSNQHAWLKINLFHDDIWHVARDFDKETRFLIDIWEGSYDAEFDRDLEKLRDDGYKVWAWGSPRGPRRY